MYIVMSIISKIYKISGMLKYSNELKNKILNFIINSFNMIKEENLKEYTATNYFKLKKEDFPYKINDNNNLNDLFVQIIFFDSVNETSIKNDGSFNPIKNELKINIPIDKEFNLNIKDLNAVLEHELMHLTQSLLNPKNNLDNMYSKFYEYTEKNNIDIESLDQEDYNSLLRKFKAENKYKPDGSLAGKPKEFNDKKYNELVKEEFGYVDHDQLANEFFPVLNDVLNEYKNKQDGTDSFLKEFIVGKNSSDYTKKFLYKIKYNKNLYNRFLKEIYKIHYELNKL